MKINRNPEQVEAFHYDMRKPEEAIETKVNVSVTPIDMTDQPDFPSEENSVLGLRVEFNIVEEQVITEPEHLTHEELTELMAPLFSVVKRLTYEVTEIALNQPGVNLDFGGEMVAE